MNSLLAKRSWRISPTPYLEEIARPYKYYSRSWFILISLTKSLENYLITSCHCTNTPSTKLSTAWGIFRSIPPHLSFFMPRKLYFVLTGRVLLPLRGALLPEPYRYHVAPAVTQKKKTPFFRPGRRIRLLKIPFSQQMH